jgi:hypothetical protein
VESECAGGRGGGEGCKVEGVCRVNEAVYSERSAVQESGVGEIGGCGLGAELD